MDRLVADLDNARTFANGEDAQAGEQTGSTAQPLRAGDRAPNVELPRTRAGASLYGSSTACFHTLKAESVNNYLIVEVDGRRLRVTAYRLDGSVLDQFTYSK